ncbi:hypothetical protein [Gracilimonas halophila]|uniref:Uncharacterized protein n=1 Tax=Gracilimonas halophila TaxID=1834464 RepID=A0ABW5JL98_9BACT
MKIGPIYSLYYIANCLNIIKAFEAVLFCVSASTAKTLRAKIAPLYFLKKSSVLSFAVLGLKIVNGKL